MQKKQFLFRKIFGQLPLLLIAAGIVLFSSCNNDKTESGPKVLAADKCFTLSWADMKSWLQPGWEDSGNANYIPRILVKTDSGSYSNPVFVAYPVDKNGIINKALGKALTNQSGTTNCGIDAKLNRTFQYYYLPAEGFYDPVNQDLIKFDYLNFVPKSTLVGTKPFLHFEISSVGGVTVARGESWPCPDYCCPGPKCPSN